MGRSGDGKIAGGDAIPSSEAQALTEAQRGEEAAAPGTVADHQVLDAAALETLLEVIGGEPALLAELIDSFLEEAPPLLASLRQALDGGDAAELRRAAHTIKSSSNDFGAITLAELCQELENMGKAGTLDGAAELVAQVEREYEQVRIALETAQADL